MMEMKTTSGPILIGLRFPSIQSKRIFSFSKKWNNWTQVLCNQYIHVLMKCPLGSVLQ